MINQIIYQGLWLLGLTGASWLIVWILVRATLKYEVLDIPNERSSHDRPTPRGGGLAITMICLLGWVYYACTTSTESGLLSWGYVSAAALVIIISGLDDLYGLTTIIRLLAHIAAAVIILFTCGWWMSVAVPWGGEIVLGWVGVLLTLVWIVGLTNAYNFMDGIDGIAGGQAVVAGLGWMLLGEMAEIPGAAWLGLLIAGTSLGFLIHNRPPARIFMGDVGSAFLGFTFAFLAVWAAVHNSRLGIAGILLVWPFVFDASFTFFRRLCKGENVFAAHRSHLYQRLVQSGCTHGKVSVLYAVLAAIGVVPAAAFVQSPVVGSWLIVALLPLMVGGLWLGTVYREKQFSKVSFPCSEQRSGRELV